MATITAPHILVVDDNSLNQQLIGKLLDRLGYRYSLVASGEEALQYLQEHDTDLVLMDCMMPGLDGFETTRQLREVRRSTNSTSQIPVVAVSAWITEAVRARCQEAGMNDFLEKPLNSARLAEVVSRWVGIARQPEH